jgi:hypothetical protein
MWPWPLAAAWAMLDSMPAFSPAVCPGHGFRLARPGAPGKLGSCVSTRVISDCHPSKGALKKITQTPISHGFYFFDAPSFATGSRSQPTRCHGLSTLGAGTCGSHRRK